MHCKRDLYTLPPLVHMCREKGLGNTTSRHNPSDRNRCEIDDQSRKIGWRDYAFCAAEKKTPIMKTLSQLLEIDVRYLLVDHKVKRSLLSNTPNTIYVVYQYKYLEGNMWIKE